MKTLKLVLFSALLLCFSFGRINAQTPCGLHAEFTSHINAGNFVEFTDASTTDPRWHITSYLWKFGDGPTSTSNVKTPPPHFYGTASTYNVCLFIEGRDTLTNGVIVTCLDSICHPVVITPCNTLYGYFGTVITGLSVKFSPYASGNAARPLTYSWDFGDNTNPSTDSSPVHTYAHAGTFNACLTITDYKGCSVQRCLQVTVTSTTTNCHASYTFKILSAFGNVQFTSTSTGPSSTDSVTSYTWSFGDNSPTSPDKNPLHIYPNAGAYKTCLTIKTVSGCTNYVCDSIHIGTNSNPCNGLTAAWTSTPLQNGAVQFAAADNNTTHHHDWLFGDGTPASFGINPVHTYTASNTYHVCLYVYIPGTNCIDSLCKDVKVSASPCAGFKVEIKDVPDNNGQTGHTLTAHVSASTTPPTYVWTTTETTASIHVTTGGRYCVEVSSGNCNAYACDTVHISTTNPCIGLTAAWTSTVLSNGNVHFIPSSTTASYNAWSFGDGTTSGDPSPTHPYATAGLYHVCHYVYLPNTNCYDSSCADIQAPVGSFCTGFSAYIQDVPDNNGGHTLYAHSGPQSTPTPTYKWSNNQTTPYIHVTQNGRYCVTVTSGNCVAEACDSVGPHTGSCYAKFSFAFLSTLNSVQFTSLSVGGSSTDTIVGYQWKFGDSNTSGSTDRNPHHTYPGPGSYYVCLTIKTVSGCMSDYCDSVRIKSCGGLNADWTQTYLATGGVQFHGVPNPTPVSNYWVFGDGTPSSTAVDPIHYYAHSGLYTVCHYVYIPGSNCMDSTCRAIQANGATSCHAEFTYLSSPTSNIVNFHDASTSNDQITKWEWHFGDNTTSTDPNPNHPYATGGTYNVCLTITTANGCTNTYCAYVKVGQNSTNNCQASFKWRAVNCLEVEFVNTSPPGYTLQRWIYGDGTTDTLSNPKHTYTHSGSYRVILHSYYGTTCVGYDTMEVSLPSCANNDTVCGVVFEDLNSNGIMDNGETGIMGVTVYVGGVKTLTDADGHYEVILPSGPHYVYIATPTGCIPTLPLIPPGGGTGNNNYNAYYIDGHGGIYCGYNFGVNCNVVHICGIVYFDANNNGVQDPGENGIPNVKVIMTDGNGHTHNASTNPNGEYCETLPAGTYTVTVIPPYPSAIINPAAITVNATAAGQTYGHNDFGIFVQPGACDLKIDIVPHACVSPGFPAWYSIQVCNVGASVSGGTVNMFYDPSLLFEYANPVQTSQNPTTQTVTWELNGLLPGQCAYYWVSFRAMSPLQIGMPVFTLADINPGQNCNDVNFINNVDTVHQVVRGSWDPNIKNVSPMGEGPQGAIRGTEELTYTISFQNSGSAPAVNVVVHDTISDNLDMETFHMIGAGSDHNYTMQFSGNDVIWKFSNIMLPDSATDEQGSHGYLKFGIKPRPGLAQGTQITNTGNIYFDYNSGVATNTTLNTIDYTLAVNNIEPTNVTITLQPNPFKDYTTIRIEGSESPYELRVYDLLGKMINHEIADRNTFTIERGSLAAGMYMYEVIQKDKVIGKGKMIAQ